MEARNNIPEEEQPPQAPDSVPPLGQTSPSGNLVPRKGWKGSLAKRALHSGARTLWNSKGKAARFTMKAIGAGMGATIGLAAGVASGDMSKAFTYTSAGALAGRAIGNKTQQMGANLINGVKNIGTGARERVSTARRAINEEKYGYDQAQAKEIERQNAKARKQFLKDDNEIRKARDLMADMPGYKGDVKNVMNAIADYKEAGITDEKLIHNAMKAEYKRDNHTDFKGDDHKSFVDVAAFADANGIGKSDITDDRRRKTLETSVENHVKGEENRSEVLGYVADIFDARSAYDQKGYYGKNQMEARRTQSSNNSTTNSSQTRTSSNRNPSRSRRRQNPNPSSSSSTGGNGDSAVS